ncbi:Fatty acid synthesis protein [Sporobacter termitidis DSM 10068]|uniref:Fatty acid synthesis protein n=1 Tax=Sporobacter termitidis DSM 10068 TaxID=1123282 RepID=A0A1M5UCC7_9FIRM|nr:glycine/sarcosine/betaine reductase complex component C subunit alpha [Sporobacter termitidis]SHH60486.1 Fatty acid synthesis protein [Sporobacter termitidis DSM 10068]
MDTLKQTVGRAFLELADALESGTYGPKPKVAVTGLGSEHGEKNVLAGAVLAARRGLDVMYIGTLSDPGVAAVYAETEEDCRSKMEQLLDAGDIDGAVTMHYPFPIGVSTVGRAAAPATGREMFIATTTGTSSADRVQGMVKNALYGIVAAKACGIEAPSVGILNIDGARQTEAALRQLQSGGYAVTFAESVRSDGGAVLRGNDVLLGTPDVLVCDPLTGNVLMKMLSAFTSGGSFETVGSGYGPGIGSGGRLVLIVSRASGAPVIANTLAYAADLIRGRWRDVFRAELASAEQAGLSKILEAKKNKPAQAAEEDVAKPAAEPVPASITGIEVMDIEDAVRVLWKNNIYAESGMGCTGPLVMISEKNHEKATSLLKAAGYID